MMKVMVDRYDEAQAKIRTLKADNSTFSAQIVDAFKKVTLKARYDLLKKYKQGLFVDTDVDEEIELYEDTLDEIGCSSSALAEEVMPTLNEYGPTRAKPPANVNPSEDR